MEIKIQLFGKVYALQLGRDKEWFKQVYFISFIEEEFEKLEVVWARHIFGLFRKN